MARRHRFHHAGLVLVLALTPALGSMGCDETETLDSYTDHELGWRVGSGSVGSDATGDPPASCNATTTTGTSTTTTGTSTTTTTGGSGTCYCPYDTSETSTETVV